VLRYQHAQNPWPPTTNRPHTPFAVQGMRAPGEVDDAPLDVEDVIQVGVCSSIAATAVSCSFTHTAMCSLVLATHLVGLLPTDSMPLEHKGDAEYGFSQRGLCFAATLLSLILDINPVNARKPPCTAQQSPSCRDMSLQVKDRLQLVWSSWRKLTPEQQRSWAEKQLGKHRACAATKLLPICTRLQDSQLPSDPHITSGSPICCDAHQGSHRLYRTFFRWTLGTSPACGPACFLITPHHTYVSSCALQPRRVPRL
jgi:hypothetical protein